jgi:hypothetical protein
MDLYADWMLRSAITHGRNPHSLKILFTGYYFNLLIQFSVQPVDQDSKMAPGTSVSQALLNGIKKRWVL